MATKPPPPKEPKDLTQEVEPFLSKLAEDAKAKGVEFADRIKVAQVLVKYMQVKAGMPDAEQGSGWEES